MSRVPGSAELLKTQLRLIFGGRKSHGEEKTTKQSRIRAVIVRMIEIACFRSQAPKVSLRGVKSCFGGRQSQILLVPSPYPGKRSTNNEGAETLAVKPSPPHAGDHSKRNGGIAGPH